MSGASRIIEIVGVAGSGKTTLTHALEDAYACHVADTLHTKLPAHWPYVAHSLPGLVSLGAASVQTRPLLSWEELKFVVYVAEWDRFLRAERRQRGGVIVLDQGPVFALARLFWGEKPATRRESFREWSARMVQRWSTELDAIVLLDARDEMLVARIDEREQPHEAKGRIAGEALELLRRHRMAYGRVLDLIETLGRPPVLRFDTGTMSPSELARELAKVLGLTRAQTSAESRPGLELIRGRSTASEDG